MFHDIRAYLERLQLPQGDASSLPTSHTRFADNAHYRLEIPSVNSIEMLRSLLARSKDLHLVVNRVTETYGIFRHTRQEIQEYLAIGEAEGIEMVFSVGPRATYDLSATRLSSQGSFIGYRLRGMEQIIHAVEDVKRAIDLGCLNILVYDEGLLWMLSKMRADGLLPPEIKFKASAHMGYCNPLSLRLLEKLGADDINPIRDLSLEMLATLRQLVKVPLDIHTDNPPGSGGFIRSYEAPEIARIAAPVYLKTGNSVIEAHGQMTSAQDGYRAAEQASITSEMVRRYFPEAIQSKPGAHLAERKSRSLFQPIDLGVL